jgi:beta-mannosidase
MQVQNQQDTRHSGVSNQSRRILFDPVVLICTSQRRIAPASGLIKLDGNPSVQAVYGLYPWGLCWRTGMVRCIVDLTGDDWRLGQAPADAFPGRATWDELDRVTQWLPAIVPGNVRADLVRAGVLPDLVFGRQAEASQWVDDHCWWLVRAFPLAISADKRVHLILRGVDYVSDLFFNGHYLGRHEGMFSPQVHEITALLRAENRLAVRIVGSRWLPGDRSTRWEQLLNQIEERFSNMPSPSPQRRDTLKCQMGFGWDFAPPVRTMGIWDDVCAVVGGETLIQEVTVQDQATRDEAALAVHLELDTRRARVVQLRCTLAGETFESPPLIVEQPLDLTPGRNCHTFEFAVPQPRLWWPWDHGRPDLYRLTVEMSDGEEPLDEHSQTIGLRQVKLDGWTLHVNGQRVYARGANWVPADILPGRVTEADYRALLTLAHQANMNMLRVWGGGLREKRAFYDLCDRMGILVWQEFPFACAFFTQFPRSRDYLDLVETEARAIVRDLRNHPSVILWCGGNEFSPQRNAPLVAALQRVVTAEDPTRPFLPASPAQGDSHNWRVWHNFQPPTAYRDDMALFASEFGLQAPPDTATLRGFIPPEELWPPGPSWAYHGAGLEKLQRYARPFFQEPESSLDAFVEASQRAQAHGLQVAIEHYRRRKIRGCGGTLIWQLNEPWPAISWALLDHNRQPKPAYEAVRRLFNPLLVSVDYRPGPFRPGDRLEGDVWLINDLAQAFCGCLVEVLLLDKAGQRAYRFAQAIDVAADSAAIVGRLRWTLPFSSSPRLVCRLIQDGQVLAANEYDLGAHDDIQPTLRQRLWSWITGLVTPS